MSSARPWIYERGTLWALDLDRDTSSLVVPQTATFGKVSREDAAALAQAMSLTNACEAHHRFDAGSKCFAARVGGKIVTYGWVSWGKECIGEFERSLRMQPHEAYVWDCATLPPYRRQGLYSALLRYIASALHKQGVRRLWICASLSNRPSIRGFAAAGFRPAIRLTYLRVLMASGVWVRDEPDASPGLAADARRALVESRETVAQPATPRGSISICSATQEKRL